MEIGYRHRSACWKQAASFGTGCSLGGLPFYDDRIAFEVFASRPFRAADLAALHLWDNVGTNYELVPPENGLIDGQARIEFTPAVSTGSSQLHLSEPGWGLHVFQTD
jgi:hypothetical protein